MNSDTLSTDDILAVEAEHEHEANTQALELVKAIMQLATLQERVGPLVPAASKKLVNDLLGSGVEARKIAKVIGRSTSYVRSLAAGRSSLSPAMFTKLVRHAIMSRPHDAE